MSKQTKKLLAAVIVLVVVIVLYFVMTMWNKAEEAKEDEDDSIALMDLSSDDITAFSYVYEDETISFVKEDDVWYLESDLDFPVEQSTIEGKLDSVVTETYSRTIEIDEDALADYGLDEPANTITITDSEGNTVTYEIGDENSTTGEYYCRVDQGTTLYMISSSMDSMLSFDIYDVADMEDFPSVDSDTIKEVSVSDGETTIELDEDDDEFTYPASLYYSAHVNYDCTDLSEYGLDDPTYTIVIKYLEEDEEEETETETETEDSEEDETEEETEETYDEADLTVITLYVGTSTDDGYYVRLEGSSEIHLMSTSYLDYLLEVLEEEEEEETETEETEAEDETEEETEETETEEETAEETEAEEETAEESEETEAEDETEEETEETEAQDETEE